MVKEILWYDFFNGDDHKQWSRAVFPFDHKTTSEAKAKALAEEHRDISQEVRNAVNTARSGGQPLYVKLTKGAKAGTIARVTQLPNLTTHTSIHNLADTGQVVVKPWYSDGYTVCHFLVEDYYGGGRFKEAQASVDGKVVLSWNCKSASVKSARPVLLLGYQGPEILVKGDKSSVKTQATMLDRYDREVKAGDLAIIGMGKGGTLIVGKITSITDARTVKIRHIGAKEEISLPGVKSEQVLLLSDDIKQVLMMEKLQSL